MKLAEVIREIGRGAAGSRPLDQTAACRLFGAILDGEVPDLELGAILAALRMRGETVEELTGFLEAASARLSGIAPPTTGGASLPVILPSYNGARRVANLTPLLALALREMGVPVLVHGAAGEFGRVTSVTVFAALDVPLAVSGEEIAHRLASEGLAVATIDTFFPALSRLLALRARLGLRSAAHSVVKLLDPFSTGGLVVAAGTHPPYLDSMRRILMAHNARGLVLRATEGEPYANPRRRPAMDLVRGAAVETLVDGEHDSLATLPHLPGTIDAATTAEWTRAVLARREDLPASLACQLGACLVGVGAAPSLAAALPQVAQRFRISGGLPV